MQPRTLRLNQLFVSLFVGTLVQAVCADTLQLNWAVLRDMFPVNGRQCQGRNFEGKTKTSYEFKSTQDISDWINASVPYESEAFLLRMHHASDNINTSWKMSVGKGGGIVSFIGPFGEALPPQVTDATKGPFTNGIWMSSATNLVLNPISVTQGGTQFTTRNLTDKPFYPPTLASHCDEELHSCWTVSWGQEETATNAKPLYQVLFYTRYTDCGDGVLEITSGAHNFSPDGIPLKRVTLPSIPVRTTTLQDWVQGSAAEDKGNILVFPRDQVMFDDVAQLGGYTAFVQNLPKPVVNYPPICINKATKEVAKLCNISTTLTTPPLVLRVRGPFSISPFHVEEFERFAVYVPIFNTGFPVTPGYLGELKFVNKATNQSVLVQGVLHWAWNNLSTFFFVDSFERISELNTKFPVNSIISVQYSEGLPREDNLALSIVYGKTETSLQSPTFVYHNELHPSTDTTFVKIFVTQPVHPGMTVMRRSYIISDRLEDIDEKSRQFVPDVHEKFYKSEAHHIGTTVKLFSHVTDMSNLSFTAFVEDSRIRRDEDSKEQEEEEDDDDDDDDDEYDSSPSQQERIRQRRAPHILETCGTPDTVTLQCVGRTTPGVGRIPFFSIQCGENDSYFGPDPFAFAKKIDGVMRPSYCRDDESHLVRPQYHLVGYFDKGDCSALMSSKYIPDCEKFLTAFPTTTTFTSLTSTTTKSTISTDLNFVKTYTRNKQKSTTSSSTTTPVNPKIPTSSSWGWFITTETSSSTSTNAPTNPEPETLSTTHTIEPSVTKTSDNGKVDPSTKYSSHRSTTAATRRRTTASGGVTTAMGEEDQSTSTETNGGGSVKVYVYVIIAIAAVCLIIIAVVVAVRRGVIHFGAPAISIAADPYYHTDNPGFEMNSAGGGGGGAGAGRGQANDLVALPPQKDSAITFLDFDEEDDVDSMEDELELETEFQFGSFV